MFYNADYFFIFPDSPTKDTLLVSEEGSENIRMLPVQCSEGEMHGISRQQYDIVKFYPVNYIPVIRETSIIFWLMFCRAVTQTSPEESIYWDLCVEVYFGQEAVWSI